MFVKCWVFQHYLIDYRWTELILYTSNNDVTNLLLSISDQWVAILQTGNNQWMCWIGRLYAIPPCLTFQRLTPIRPVCTSCVWRHGSCDVIEHQSPSGLYLGYNLLSVQACGPLDGAVQLPIDWIADQRLLLQPIDVTPAQVQALTHVGVGHLKAYCACACAPATDEDSRVAATAKQLNQEFQRLKEEPWLKAVEMESIAHNSRDVIG